MLANKAFNRHFVKMTRFNETDSEFTEGNIFAYVIPDVPGGGLSDLVPTARGSTFRVYTRSSFRPGSLTDDAYRP